MVVEVLKIVWAVAFGYFVKTLFFVRPPEATAMLPGGDQLPSLTHWGGNVGVTEPTVKGDIVADEVKK